MKETPWTPLSQLRWVLAFQLSRGRRGRRTQAEVEAERAKLRNEVEAGLAPLIAEMHQLLPRQKATCVGVIYARYSTDFHFSVLDQIREIFERCIDLKFLCRPGTFSTTWRSPVGKNGGRV